MAWAVLLAIITFPLVEVAIFVKAAGLIGILPTIAVAVLAGMAGLALLRLQGLQTLMRARQTFDRGEVPVAQVFDGICLVIAGVFLLIPGFLGDAIALLLLLPPVRRLLRNWLIRHSRVVAATADGRHSQPTVIEVEYHEIGPEDRSRD